MYHAARKQFAFFAFDNYSIGTVERVNVFVEVAESKAEVFGESGSRKENGSV